MKTLLTRSTFAGVLLAASLTTQETWRPVLTSSTPDARERAAMAYDMARGRIVLFGGLRDDPVSGRVLLGDTWTYDGTDWMRHTTSGPAPRFDHGMGWDPLGARVVLAGGSDGGNRVDTWSWDGTTWTPLGDLPTQDRTNICRRLDYAADFGALLYATDRDTFALNGGLWSRVAGQVMFTPEAPTDFMVWAPERKFLGCFAYPSAPPYVVFRELNFHPSSPNNGWWTGSFMTSSQVSGSHMYAVPDPYRGVILVAIGGKTYGLAGFGGSGSEIHTLRQLDPDLAGATMAFDAARRRAVVFGGRIGASYVTTTYELVPAQQAGLSAYGSGCPAGPAGTPSLGTIPTLGGLPYVGGRLALLASRFAPNAPAYLILGFDDQSWGGRSLPFSLNALGMTGCTLLVRPNDVVGLGTTSAAGEARALLHIPAEPTLAGGEFFAQALATWPSANALGIAWTDAVAAVIGER